MYIEFPPPNPERTMNRSQKLKCMRIAKDVLKHIRTMKVKQRVYCRGTVPDTVSNVPAGQDDDAQKHIKGLSKNCEVCAVGACFMSYVRLYDNVQLSEFAGPFGSIYPGGKFEPDYDVIFDTVRNVFSQAQLCLIEAAFEKGGGYDHTYVVDPVEGTDGYGNSVSEPDTWNYDPDEVTTTQEIAAATKFGKKHRSATNRLKAIMQNLLRNKGLFIPDKQLYNQIQKKLKGHKRIAVEIV